MVSATVIGGVLGFGVQIYANAVRKLPLMQGPWQHALAAGAGAAFGAYVLQFEAKTEKELNGAIFCVFNHAVPLRPCRKAYPGSLTAIFLIFAFPAPCRVVGQEGRGGKAAPAF